jgi:hypothetical protein
MHRPEVVADKYHRGIEVSQPVDGPAQPFNLGLDPANVVGRTRGV